ncbi:gp58-like family protein, partial [Pediococcus ethanolidurans]|uniref:gp58-like family protein n=1 Tax=Pediococcus ethanolidurans TaxID=319653 RepID=UPI0021E96947
QQQFTNINGQLESKVSKDTYDTLAGTVSETSTMAKQNKNALVSKADSSTVNTLTQRVSTAENTLTQTATKTALEQTKTDVDNINKTVRTNASNISAQAGKIDGLLSTTNKLGDQYTNLSGKFNLSSKTWETNFSKVQSSVDAVARGGRNLILNSADLSSFLTWTANGSKPTVSADGHEMTIVTKHGGLNINSVNLSKDLPNIGDTVTISVEAKGTATLQFNYNNGDNYVGSQNFTISDDYKRYSAQFVWNPVAGTNQQFVVYTADHTDTTMTIRHPQIEISSVAHDWSPAPEDQATVTALTQVKQTAEGASQLSKDNHGNILALQSTAKGLQTSVSNAATKDQLNILSDTFSNKISSATSAANSKMIQTINNVGIGFKNPDGSKFQMNLSADGTALLDFSKIMLNGQTNIQAATIGNAQIANGAINQAKIGKLAVGNAQIANGAITNAKIGNVDAGKITTGILDASHLNVDDVIANVINGKTITGITINTPTLNLGTNGTLTTSFNLNQATSLYAPKKGTGTLRIGTGVINARSDNMSRYSNTKGYWYGFDDNGSMVKNGTNHTGDDYAPGYEKHDIMKSNGNVLNRSYLDAMALALNEGGTKTFNTMLTAIGLETGNALLHQDLATEGTFEARLGTGNKYGFKIDRQVISPMIRANHYTYAADVFISRYGTMGLSTSTKVNKLDIADVPDMLQKGYNLLTLNPRQWFDKTSVEAYADVQAGNTDSVESVVDIKPVTGMVAEEVASAGLDDYVIKDENNKVQGLAYDRLWTLLLPVLRDMNDRLNEAQLEITKLKRGCLK